MQWAYWFSWCVGGVVLVWAIAWVLAAHWDEQHGDNHF